MAAGLNLPGLPALLQEQPGRFTAKGSSLKADSTTVFEYYSALGQNISSEFPTITSPQTWPLTDSHYSPPVRHTYQVPIAWHPKGQNY